MCPNSECKFQKKTTFTLKQFQLEGSGFKSKLKKNKASEKVLNNFIEPGLKIASPFVSEAVAAKTKNFQAPQKTSNILASQSNGKT